jgi:hypothetical protein
MTFGYNAISHDVKLTPATAAVFMSGVSAKLRYLAHRRRNQSPVLTASS